MKHTLLLSLLFSCAVSLAADEAAPQVSSENANTIVESSDWGRRRIKLRIGQVTENPDPAIENSWEHQSGQSPQYSAGLFWNFPGRWQKVRFLLGGEYKYLKSRAELSGLGKASIESTFNQLMAVWGVELRPLWARPFGFSFALAFEVWGEKRSSFHSSGFKESLGTGRTYDSSSEPSFLLPAIFESSVFWEITSNWKMALTSDARRQGNALTLGVDYVF